VTQGEASDPKEVISAAFRPIAPTILVVRASNRDARPEPRAEPWRTAAPFPVLRRSLRRWPAGCSERSAASDGRMPRIH